MSIDPRTIQQLLQLQFQSATPLSPKSAEGTSPFAHMLEALLEQGRSDLNNRLPANAAAGLPAQTGLAPSVYSSNAVLQSLQRSAVGTNRPGAFDPIVEQASEAHGVDAGLIKAVIDTESSFNPYAVSHAGAKGLMQLMDRTAKGLGVTDSFDPAQNIDGGTRFLAGLLDKYNGNEAVALAAYNAGPGRVDRLGIRTDADLRDKLHLLPAETQAYVEKVLERKRLYA